MWFALAQENIMQQLPHPEEEVSVTFPDEVHDALYLSKKVVLISIKDINGPKRK